MSNPDPTYDEALARSRQLGIPIIPPSQNDEAMRSMVEKYRSDTEINEKKELLKIRSSEITLQHTLWGKTIANITLYLLTLGMFVLGGLLLYRDKPGDADRAKWLIGLSSSVILASATSRSLRSLTEPRD